MDQDEDMANCPILLVQSGRQEKIEVERFVLKFEQQEQQCRVKKVLSHLSGGPCSAYETVNEDDVMLRSLKQELGNDAYEAVVTALKEMNEF
ncbi:hypothetical protein RJ640_021488 [Escallonia rubra]|uniref:Factor of DNA methylation 1-5/IDN2 domain-containing protein n=1 Tax=Escallonia rubra TaxID=112253 RepID=A0AA88QQR4_9ASTE|nr:hypothetical protein RJ640_021488 [Escallonia rubra]